MHPLLATSKLAVIDAWLPLTRELLSVSETEGENNTTQVSFYNFSLPPSFCFAKIHLPRQREARYVSISFFIISLKFCSPLKLF